jgi:hypothetical protein
VVAAQKEVCAHVAQGVVETLGLRAWPSPELDGVWVELPAGSDIDEVARAIECEGAAARRDAESDYLLLAVQPWFDLGEIDQTILCCAKVVHVLLGVHPPDTDIEQHLAEGSACHVNNAPVLAGSGNVNRSMDVD